MIKMDGRYRSVGGASSYTRTHELTQARAYYVLGLAGSEDSDGDGPSGEADSDANDAARGVLRINGLHYLFVCVCVCVCVCGGGGGGGCEGLDPRGGPIQGEAPELQAPAAAQLATRIGPM